MKIVKETNWLMSSYSAKIQRGFFGDDDRWYELFLPQSISKEEANK